MEPGKAIQEIITARDKLDDAHTIQCTCSSFALQYNGSCGCGKYIAIAEANSNFWKIIKELSNAPST